MNNPRKLTTAICLILGGSLLRAMGASLDSYVGTAIALTGLVFLIIGLRRLKYNLSEENRSGPKLLLISVYLGILSAIFDVIPFIGGLIAGLFGLIILILELVGFVKLKNAPLIKNRKNGISYLIAAVIIGILIGVVEFAGNFLPRTIMNYVNGGFLIIMSILFINGWTKLSGSLAEGSSLEFSSDSQEVTPSQKTESQLSPETDELFD